MNGITACIRIFTRKRKITWNFHLLLFYCVYLVLILIKMVYAILSYVVFFVEKLLKLWSQKIIKVMVVFLHEYHNNTFTSILLDVVEMKSNTLAASQGELIQIFFGSIWIAIFYYLQWILKNFLHIIKSYCWGQRNSFLEGKLLCQESDGKLRAPILK